MLRISAAALAALTLAAPASAQAPRNAVGMVSDFSSWFVTAQSQYTANIIAQTLEAAMKRSRDSARIDSQPMPDEVRAALIPFYPAELLDNVRYSVGDVSPDGLAGFAIRNGNAAAVTLIDTVVFKDQKYVNNLALWAHEIHHVEQYTQWGVAGFASRYAFGWESVEAEARQRAEDFVAWYKEHTKADN